MIPDEDIEELFSRLNNGDEMLVPIRDRKENLTRTNQPIKDTEKKRFSTTGMTTAESGGSQIDFTFKQAYPPLLYIFVKRTNIRSFLEKFQIGQRICSNLKMIVIQI